MRFPLGTGALTALGLWVLIGAPAGAEQDQGKVPWGTIDAPGALAAAAPNAAEGCAPSGGACAPAFGPIAEASLASGGCGLRNRGDCGIDISNARGPAQIAYLLWSVILGGAVTDPGDPRVATIGVAHNGASTTISGAVIGTGPTPCWGGGPLAVYAGTIPLSIVNSPSANGHYGIAVTPGGSGLTTGEDPWSGNVVYPLFEGAGIVVVGTGSGTVYGWGGPPFSGFEVPGGAADYLLGIPSRPNPGAVANLVGIVADGQIGFSAYTADPTLAIKSTRINGVAVAGAGSPFVTGSQFNGDTAAPLPRLFDVGETDIGAMGAFAHSTAVPGFPASMAVHITAGFDCLSLIAYALEVH